MPGLVDCGVVLRTALPSGNTFFASFDQSLQGLVASTVHFLFSRPLCQPAAQRILVPRCRWPRKTGCSRDNTDAQVSLPGVNTSEEGVIAEYPATPT